MKTRSISKPVQSRRLVLAVQFIVSLRNSPLWLISANLLIVTVCGAADENRSGSLQTNRPLASMQRLERGHLQAVHEARLRFAQKRHPVANHGLYEDFRAIMHVHAEDAEHTKGTRPQLLAAAQKAGIRILLTTDHRGPKPEAWRGLREGVLFIAGSETGDGTLWYPDYGTDGQPIAGSGLRFMCHIEERYQTPTDGLVGMEICNRHTDAILDKGPQLYLGAAMALPSLWQAALDNFHSFPDEFFAAGTDYRKEIFAKWDRETQSKPFTGIGANDAHQNVILKDVTFDPYEVSFRNLVTHILARELTEPLIREALTNGHVYVAHDWLCDPTGFTFGAVNNLGVFPMGDEAVLLGRTRLTAMTPLAAKLRLIHKGLVIQETSGTNLTFEVKEPGAYRLEAWLTVDGEDRPWIYSNPVYLRSPGLAELRLPSMQLDSGIEAHKDIAYREGPADEAAKHKLDVYAQKDKRDAPVLFFIHGGAWRTGDRAQYVPLGNRYAREGYVIVVPSYRLAPKYPHPAQIEDVAAAFAWTVKHVGEYGGDTNRIFVAGHSAGGHLAALLALEGDYLASYGVSTKSIRGVLALSGVYDLTDPTGQASVFGTDLQVRRAASPLFQIKPGAPPFLVTYCQWDYFSLPGQARGFQHALKEAGLSAELVFIPHESHISEMVHVTNPEDPTVTAALKFMRAFN
jgi:acetyl esterase/lipase